jgi:hypothetical protein
MFGNTLEEVMELQKEDHPHLEVPWVIVELTETILRLRGPSTQGIFRYCHYTVNHSTTTGTTSLLLLQAPILLY